MNGEDHHLPFEMVEEEAGADGFKPRIIGSIKQEETTAQDTREAADRLQKAGVDLILFLGGDSTAPDTYSGNGDRGVVLGIPARLSCICDQHPCSRQAGSNVSSRDSNTRERG